MESKEAMTDARRSSLEPLLRGRVRPWRLVYTLALTLMAVYWMGWMVLPFMTAVQLDIRSRP